MEKIPVLRGIVDACLFIYQQIKVLEPTDLQKEDLKKTLGWICQQCDLLADDIIESSFFEKSE